MWIDKLTLEVIDQDDGSGIISIKWDETDPELVYWNELGTEGQQQFIMDAVYNAIKTTGGTSNDD